MARRLLLDAGAMAQHLLHAGRKIGSITFTAARSGGGGSPPVGTTWDAASKSGTPTLAGLVASSTHASPSTDAAKSLPARSTGKRALKFIFEYSGAGEDGEIQAGLVVDSWTPGPSILASGFVTLGDGYLCAMDDGMGGGETFTDLGLTVASGEWVAFLIDESAGKGWMKTAAGTAGADPEAGTGEHFVFDPGTAFTAGTTLYAISGTTRVTLDPTYSSGTFAAWDS